MKFGRKMNQDLGTNRKLYGTKVNGGKVQSYSRIKDGNWRLPQGRDEV